MGQTDLKILKEQQGTRAERFVRSYDRARRESFRLSEEGARNVVTLSNELRAEMTARLRRASPLDSRAPFSVRIVPGISAELDETLAELERRFDDTINTQLSSSFDLGSRVTAGAFGEAGVSVAFPSISPELLTTISTRSLDVLRLLTTNLRDKITNELNNSAAGLQSASQATNKIERLLRTSRVVAGRRRRIGFGSQAEAIVRTETQRAYSVAQQAASEQIAETIPELKKRWVTSLRERRGHREAEGRYAPGGSIGPIPVKQRFEIFDFSRTGTTRFITIGGRASPPRGTTIAGQRVLRVPLARRRGRVIVDRMLHPRDPAASAGNVIQCSCISIEVVPDLEKAMEKSIGILSV